MVYDYRDSSAVAALNSYVWKLLETNLDWDIADYSGVKPIIPTQQQPELMQTGNPFIVYGAAILPASHLYALRTETIAYNVYATSTVESNRVAQLLADAFERQDVAAADVNDWIDLEGADGNRPTKRLVRFGTVRLTMVEMAEPTDEEGGFYSALVLLEARYTQENDTAQFSGFTYP